jgi:hypothetical protein
MHWLREDEGGLDRMDGPLPWMKLYGRDWRSDTALRSCSFAGRGFAIDAITLMHEAVPYGHLLINGRIPSGKQLAALLGAKSAREVESLLNELLSAGAFVKKADGTIYWPRMVRDHAKAVEGRGWANKRWNGNQAQETRLQEPNGSPSGAPTTQTPHTRIQNLESSSLRSDDRRLSPSDLEQAMADWNALANELSLPSVQRFTQPRKAKLQARLNECGGLDGWRSALAKVRANSWMHGANERGWKAHFDFLLQESCFTKLMEGTYDRASANGLEDASRYTNGFAALLSKGRHRDQN